MRRTETFAAEAASVPAARRFATDLLVDCSEDVRQTVELMVSEIATNGVRHGQTSFDLAIQLSGGEIRVEVTDQGSGVPTMRSPGPDEPTGRGLRIVDMLADQWGVDPAAGAGKTVWFTVNTGAEEEDPAERSRSVGGRFRSSREPTAWTFAVRSPALAGELC